MSATSKAPVVQPIAVEQGGATGKTLVAKPMMKAKGGAISKTFVAKPEAANELDPCEASLVDKVHFFDSVVAASERSGNIAPTGWLSGRAYGFLDGATSSTELAPTRIPPLPVVATESPLIEGGGSLQ